MIYRPDPALMNAYADMLERSVRAITACQRAQRYLELADVDGLEKQLLHTLELQREHIKKVAEEEAEKIRSAKTG